MALTEIDRTLLRRCLAEEPGAWKDFVDRFLGLFIHVVQHTGHVRSVRLSAEDTDDLCAEIFVTLLSDQYAVLRNFRGLSSLATYLTVIARRVVVREITRRRMSEAMGHVDAHSTSLDQAQASHIQHQRDQQRIEDQEEIQLILDGLPFPDSEVVRQFHIEGRSYREISLSLNIPENSIGPTLTRAREKLRAREVRAS
ncbi:MAG: polymerase sigma factor [Planctomycetaceae bacterium]|nr:polymerase sigma factor [Planctomycetaceae bacterium]